LPRIGAAGNGQPSPASAEKRRDQHDGEGRAGEHGKNCEERAVLARRQPGELLLDEFELVEDRVEVAARLIGTATGEARL